MQTPVAPALPGIWVDDPEAVALLAHCAASPPLGQHRFYYHVCTRDERYEYDRSDWRVARLNAIADESLTQAIQDALAGDGGAFENWRACPGVDEVIRTAVAGWKVRCLNEAAEARRQVSEAGRRRSPLYPQ